MRRLKNILFLGATAVILLGGCSFITKISSKNSPTGGASSGSPPPITTGVMTGRQMLAKVVNRAHLGAKSAATFRQLAAQYNFALPLDNSVNWITPSGILAMIADYYNAGYLLASSDCPLPDAQRQLLTGVVCTSLGNSATVWTAVIGRLMNESPGYTLSADQYKTLLNLVLNAAGTGSAPIAIYQAVGSLYAAFFVRPVEQSN